MYVPPKNFARYIATTTNCWSQSASANRHREKVECHSGMTHGTSKLIIEHGAIYVRSGRQQANVQQPNGHVRCWCKEIFITDVVDVQVVASRYTKICCIVAA